MSYSGFLVNGRRFHTKHVQRSTQNSGVSLEAKAVRESELNENASVVGSNAYYGVLQEIFVLDYHAFQIPMFRCDWASIDRGVKVEDGFTLVNLHQYQNQFKNDPFILASQAKQVFYSRESNSSSWYVVLKPPPRGFHELESYDENMDTTCQPMDVSRLENDSDNEDESYERRDCEGILV